MSTWMNGLRRWMGRSGAAIGLSLLMVGAGGIQADDRKEPEVILVRPADLQQAADEIRFGQAAQAQTRLETFLENDGQGAFKSYRPEALYLLGQSLAAQGRYQEAKKKFDKAIDESKDKNLTGFAGMARADCNIELGEYHLASRQLHWIETFYRDTPAIPHDEVMYKLGFATKRSGFQSNANYWFKQVIDLYATGPWAEKAKLEHSEYTPKDPNKAPRVYSLEVDEFGKLEKAEAEAEVLRAKGYRDVQVIPTKHFGNTVYEVHVGKFDNKSDAMKAHIDAKLAGLATRIRPATIEVLK